MLALVRSYSQSTFSDTIITDPTDSWDIARSFSLLNSESTLIPIINSHSTGNGVRLAKVNNQGALQDVVRLVDTSITRHSHLAGIETIVKINDNRHVVPLIRVLDTINFTADSVSLYFLSIDSTGQIIDSSLFDIPNGGQYNFRDSYVDSDSTFILLGTIKQINNNNWDISVLKFDTSFNLLWDKRFGDIEDDAGVSLNALKQGGYLLTSFHEYPGGVDRNTGIYKLDINGDLVWYKYYGKSNFDMDGGYATVLPDDSFYLLSKDWRDGEAYSDLLLTKFNQQGDSIWSVRYQKGGETEYPFSPPVILDNGDLLLPALYYDSNATNYENGGTIGWLIKVDSLGSVIWEQDLNYFEDLNSPQFVSYNNYFDIEKSNDGGFILSGHISRIDLFGQEFFGLITRIDSNGCLLSECADYTGINIIREDNFDIVFYPNPSTGIYYLKSDSKVESLSINLYNVSGKLILSKDLSSGDYLDLRDYTSGFYVYLCNDGNGNISSGKILLSK